MGVITIELLSQIKKHYRLRWNGTHGIIHWSRVYDNGIKLSEQEGIRSKVVQLFSVFHDSQRKNEHLDKYHGKRGAALAVKLRDYLAIGDDDFQLLIDACSLHTNRLDHPNITIQTCMDADRLDLGRVAKHPDPNLLCTPLAKQKETIKWAYQRSLIHKLSEQTFGLDQKWTSSKILHLDPAID